MNSSNLQESWDKAVVFDGGTLGLPALTLGQFYRIIDAYPNSYAKCFMQTARDVYLESEEVDEGVPAIMAEYLRRALRQERGLEPVVQPSVFMDKAIERMMQDVGKAVGESILHEAHDQKDEHYMSRRNMLLRVGGGVTQAIGVGAAIAGSLALAAGMLQPLPETQTQEEKLMRSKRFLYGSLVTGAATVVSIVGTAVSAQARDRRNLLVDALEAQQNALDGVVVKPEEQQDEVQKLVGEFMQRCNDIICARLKGPLQRYIDDVIREMNGDQRKLFKGF